MLSALAAFLAVWWGLAPPSARGRAAAMPPPVRGFRQRPLRWCSAIGIGALVAIGAWFVSGAWWLSLVGVPVPWVLQRWLPYQDEHRERELARHMPEALALLDACVRAGLPLRRAVQVVGEAMSGETGCWLTSVDDALRVGTDEAEAWRQHRHEPVVGRLARDIARSVGSGAALSQVLCRHRDDVWAQHRAQVLERARAVGVRSVMPLMCCFLPAFVALGVVPIIASVAGRILG